jgi:transcriptional regulator with XRE-family HTH domain
MSTLGERIAQLRKDKNLTQSRLAQKLSVNRATLSNWEIGRALPDVNMLVVIADFFNVTTDYLLGRGLLKDPVPGGSSEIKYEFNLPEEAFKEFDEFKNYLNHKYSEQKKKAKK